MGIPDYGAGPLSQFFLLCRLLSFISLVTIIGLTSNFVAVIVNQNVAPPKEIIGALSVTSIATLYILISVPFFLSEASLGLFIMSGIDSLLLLAFLIISVVFGRPLSFLNCPALLTDGPTSNGAAWVQSLAANVGKSGDSLRLWDWVGAERVVCFETKAIWGLCIALCILLTCTSLVLPTLFFKNKKKYARRALPKGSA